MPVPKPSGLSDDSDSIQEPRNPCLPFEQDERAFYQALKADDQRAWNCLYIRVNASFVPYACQRSLISYDDANDILQEAMAEFSIKLRDGRYVYQDKPVAAYVFIVCRNRWASFLKKNKLARKETYHETVVNDNAAGADYEPANTFSLSVTQDEETVRGDSEIADSIWAQSEVDWEAVSRAFAEISEDCRTLLQNFYVAGKSLKEAGEEIGLQENSAKVKRFRCAQRLRMLYMKYRQDE